MVILDGGEGVKVLMRSDEGHIAMLWKCGTDNAELLVHLCYLIL